MNDNSRQYNDKIGKEFDNESDALELLGYLLDEQGIEAAMPEGIPRREGAGTDGERPPLSFAQERMWFLHRLMPDSPYYNIPMAVKMSGAIDVEALRRSLARLVERHESLRTLFAVQDGRPVQVIHPSGTVPLRVVDLEGMPSQEREAESVRLAVEETLLPFDLEKGPLFRALLIRLSREEHVLVTTIHHIVFDDWSMGVLVRELTLLYDAERKGTTSVLPSLPIQYADFAVWQRSLDLKEGLEYWKEQLAGIPPLLRLATDRPRPAAQTYRGTHASFEIEGSVGSRLEKLAREEGGTLFMGLLAAFDLLLCRWSGGRQDIPVGSMIANRNRPELEGLIGFFSNTILLRSNLSGNPTFRELLRRVRETTLAAYAHQDVPFESILEVLAPERSPAYTPLFQVMMVLENAHGDMGMDTGEGMDAVPLETRTARFDLLMFLSEAGDSIPGTLEYSTDLFDADTIRQLLDDFLRILQAAVAEPDTSISDLLRTLPPPMLSVALTMADEGDEQAEAIVEGLALRLERASIPCHIERRDHEGLASVNPDGVNIVVVGNAATDSNDDVRIPESFAGRINADGSRFLIGIVPSGNPERDAALLERLSTWSAGRKETTVVMLPAVNESDRSAGLLFGMTLADFLPPLLDSNVHGRFWGEEQRRKIAQLPAPDLMLTEIMGRSGTEEGPGEREASPLEQELSGIFAGVLGRDQVGINDNFFALGGDSLRAVQVLMAVQEEYGVELSLQDLMESPTVEALATALLEAQAADMDEEFLSELENLSDEEVERLLRERGEEQSDGNKG